MARIKSNVNEARKAFQKEVKARAGKTSGMTGALREAQKARKAANARIRYQLKKAGLDLTPEQAGITLPKIGKGRTKEELQRFTKSYKALTAEDIQRMIQEDVIPTLSYRKRFYNTLNSFSPYLAEQFDNAMEYVKSFNNLTEEQLEEELAECEADINEIEESYYKYRENGEERAEHAAKHYLSNMLETKFGVNR